MKNVICYKYQKTLINFWLFSVLSFIISVLAVAVNKEEEEEDDDDDDDYDDDGGDINEGDDDNDINVVFENI